MPTYEPTPPPIPKPPIDTRNLMEIMRDARNALQANSYNAPIFGSGNNPGVPPNQGNILSQYFYAQDHPALNITRPLPSEMFANRSDALMDRPTEAQLVQFKNAYLMNNFLKGIPGGANNPNNAGGAANAGEQLQMNDPYLTALYEIMGSNSANTSGYDSVLSDLAGQKKSAAKRYQTYTAQISDLFGNLGRKSDTYAQEQAGIANSASATRSQLAAQQMKQAEATRMADATRLKTANEARTALGLTEAAAASAGGDFATQQSEGALKDQGALGQTTIDTILANEALAKLVSSRQAGGFDMAGQQAQSQLNMSYEDLLASLSGQEAQTKLQKSQALSAGAVSPSEKVSILNAAQNYQNAQANTGGNSDPATTWINANPNSATGATQLLQSFIPWFTTKAPGVNNDTGKTPTLSQMINAYTKDNPDGSDVISSDPALYNLLQVYTGLK